jgi:hypothetical protein
MEDNFSLAPRKSLPQNRLDLIYSCFSAHIDQ